MQHTTTTTQIEPALAGDLSAILALLQANSLPGDGLSEHLGSTLVARRGSELVGSAALELYPPAALLRSVAVAPALHGQGLGGELIWAALELAREKDISQVYLLTITAPAYFPRFGFQSVARDAVPAGVQCSVEFALDCCQSGQAMRLELT